MKDLFIDEARISVAGGAGGNGCMSFRREKYVPRGGPNGGDGGNGGCVVLVADASLRTLYDQRYRRRYHAPRGRHGLGSMKNGKRGEDIEIRVPTGTTVHDAECPEAGMLVDLVETGQRFFVARGGRGGRGNSRFATATRQAPDFCEEGRPGATRELILALKLLADVGLVGLPNAGKSTLLSRISAARPKVAAYPFTTLTPCLGIVESDDQRFAVADIPGLIAGASKGAGLGDRFLRHIERTRVLLHLLDASAWQEEGRSLLGDYETIREELGSYDPRLRERAEIVAINKIDVVADAAPLDALESELRRRGASVHRISGATGEGLPGLLRDVAKRVFASEERSPADDGSAR